MYQVLARKYRPRNFIELVGQNHVSRALTSALERGRLHHAYLFTGTRGVGKTTIARILAKCLNCETGITSTPCEVCATCTAVNEGRFIDLIEIDAASRTKVEDTRELLDNVPYAPTQGRFKVYLIDEVHMLSTHSFNALLKTLEEPPAHVKFLFATTDPQKLPITVISRCLQFTLRPLAVDEITTHLTDILNQEKISAEQDAIWQIAESAQGSLRDALSLTDQAIAYGQGAIQHQDVKEMLGLIDRTIIFDLILAINQNQQQHVSALLMQFRQQALDVSLVLDQFISTLHELALLQYLPDLSLKYSAEINQKIMQLSGLIAAQDLQLYYQVACKGRADLQLAVTQEQGFEMCILRLLAFRPLQMNEVQNSAAANIQHNQTPQRFVGLDDAGKQNQAAKELSNNFQAHQTYSAQSLDQPSNLDDVNIRQSIVDSVSDHEKNQNEVQEFSNTKENEINEGFHSTSQINPKRGLDVEVQDLNDLDLKHDFNNDLNTNAEDKVQSHQFDDNAEHLNQTSIDLAHDLNAGLQVDSLDYSDSTQAQNDLVHEHVDTSTNDVPELSLFGDEKISQAVESFNTAATDDIFFLDPASKQDDSQALVSSAVEDEVTHTLVVDEVDDKTEEAPIKQSVNNTATNEMPQDILKLIPQELEGDWTLDKWEYWLRNSDLTPAVQELAQQGVMTGQIDGESIFYIPQKYEKLLTQFQSNMEEMLRNRWSNNRLSVKYQELSGLTPYDNQVERKQRAYQRAEVLLSNETVVKGLVDVFGGTLQNIQLKP